MSAFVAYLLIIVFVTGLGLGGVIGYCVSALFTCAAVREELITSYQRELRLTRNYDRLTEATLQHVGINIALPGASEGDSTSVAEPAPGWFARKSEPSLLDKAL